MTKENYIYMFNVHAQWTTEFKEDYKKNIRSSTILQFSVQGMSTIEMVP